jgi:hypothetical protein
MKDLLAEIKQEFPKFKLVHKRDSSLMKVIDLFLKVITFWKMRDFMRTFTTTIGCTVYVPSSWPMRPPKSRMIILRHERIHMRQRKRLWLWYSLSYLLLPVPALWAYFRMKYEMEAYEESLRAVVEYYGTPSLTPVLKEKYVAYFTGPSYFWTWPWRKRVERWYDGVIARLQE